PLLVVHVTGVPLGTGVPLLLDVGTGQGTSAELLQPLSGQSSAVPRLIIQTSRATPGGRFQVPCFGAVIIGLKVTLSVTWKKGASRALHPCSSIFSSDNRSPCKGVADSS